MTAADTSRVSFAVDARGVGRLRLIAAERRNAIDAAFVAELGEAVAAAGADPAVRAILLHADGPAFTVGGDMRYFAGRVGELEAALDEMIGPYHEALLALAGGKAPVVAAIQGAAAGGGLGLAWCSDVVLASTEAVFATGFARLALSGDGGSSWWLPRLVGLRRAQELLLRNRVLDAHEALEWGLVSEVLAPADLLPRAEAVAAELADGPTRALAAIRTLLREAPGRTLAEHYAAELEATRECARVPEAREGIAAFAERREPDFRDV